MGKMWTNISSDIDNLFIINIIKLFQILEFLYSIQKITRILTFGKRKTPCILSLGWGCISTYATIALSEYLNLDTGLCNG